jgi:hypothetical protein
MALPDQAFARGANFVLALAYVREVHGEAVLARALDRLSPADRRVWDGPPLLIGTYDFGAFKAFTVAVARETGTGGDRALAEMYAFIADRSLSSLYKVFFRLANPAFVLGNFPRLWSRFFTAGVVQVPHAAKEAAELRFTLPPVFLDWLGPACLGYSTKAIQLAGGRDARVQELRRHALANGDWEVDYKVTWREGA